MKRWILPLAAGVAAVTGFVAIAVPASAHGGFGWGFGGDRDASIAKHLGVTVDQLQSARDAAMDEALDAAVQAGRITQEQADLRKASRTVTESIDQDAVLATALGVSTDEVAKARADGTLRDLAGTNFDRTAYRDAMQAAVTKAIDDAAAAGTITSDQATQLKDQGLGGGCMGMGGHRMRGGGFGGDGLGGVHQGTGPGLGGTRFFRAPSTLPSSNL